MTLRTILAGIVTALSTFYSHLLEDSPPLVLMAEHGLLEGAQLTYFFKQG